MAEYIYLLQLLHKRYFFSTKEEEYIYKIGKTKQENIKRICNYENDSILVCQIKCNDCDKLEKVLITLFEEKYKSLQLQNDMPYEWFDGNCNDMIYDIYNYIKDEDKYVDAYEKEIKKIFTNYKDDESFGGTKRLIKYLYDNIHNRSDIYYITDEKKLGLTSFKNNQFGFTYFKLNCFRKNYYGNLKYIDILIEENDINTGSICNFNEIIKRTDDAVIEHLKNNENFIKKIWKNYKDDESFGGTKKLIKFSFVNNRIDTYYINDEKELEKMSITGNWFQKDCYDINTYITRLLENNVIQDGLICDFNDIGFIKKLIKYKIKINITYTEENFVDIIYEFNTFEQKIDFKIQNMIHGNCFLNKKIYCNYSNNVLVYHVSNHNIYPRECYECIIRRRMKVIEINTIKYDYLFLRKYTPYMIEINDNEYYLYNRDYQIIDKNEKKYSVENWKGKRIYLYNDKYNPIILGSRNKEIMDMEELLKMVKMLNDMKSKYNSITLNMKCMNMNENTNMILNL